MKFILKVFAFSFAFRIFVWNYFKYDKGHIKIWIRIKKIKENFNLISEYRRCFQISFKKKKFWRIYQNLPEFLHVKNRTFNFNRTHKREDVLRERSKSEMDTW